MTDSFQCRRVTAVLEIGRLASLCGNDGWFLTRQMQCTFFHRAFLLQEQFFGVEVLATGGFSESTCMQCTYTVVKPLIVDCQAQFNRLTPAKREILTLVYATLIACVVSAFGTEMAF